MVLQRTLQVARYILEELLSGAEMREHLFKLRVKWFAIDDLIDKNVHFSLVDKLGNQGLCIRLILLTGDQLSDDIARKGSSGNIPESIFHRFTIIRKLQSVICLLHRHEITYLIYGIHIHLHPSVNVVWLAVVGFVVIFIFLSINGLCFDFVLRSINVLLCFVLRSINVRLGFVLRSINVRLCFDFWLRSINGLCFDFVLRRLDILLLLRRLVVLFRLRRLVVLLRLRQLDILLRQIVVDNVVLVDVCLLLYRDDRFSLLCCACWSYCLHMLGIVLAMTQLLLHKTLYIVRKPNTLALIGVIVVMYRLAAEISLCGIIQVCKRCPSLLNLHSRRMVSKFYSTHDTECLSHILKFRRGALCSAPLCTLRQQLIRALFHTVADDVLRMIVRFDRYKAGIRRFALNDHGFLFFFVVKYLDAICFHFSKLFRNLIIRI